MRLGVVGMLPSDFRQITAEHLKAISALKLTGGAFHAPGDKLFGVTVQECRKVRDTFVASGMDLVQFGIGFGECLFDPDEKVRQQALAKIERGIEVARQLEAHACLIRTGSLSPRGSYSPARANHTPQCRARLVEMLKKVAAKAEAEGVTMAIETHLLTIMDSPETNREILEEIGSARLRVVMDFVNHFQTLHQVYNSQQRLEHIFRLIGALSAVGHCKDIVVREGFVVHLDEELPGDGELDLACALRLWHQYHPQGYMLLEHLPNEKYPRAAENVHRIIVRAGIPLH
jgi:sugar phosphate isomerase/epimerase